MSDSELLGLLEKEYTHKLSGRLGLTMDTAVSPEYDFVQCVYQAYQLADHQTRQAFAGLCQSMLNINVSMGLPSAAGPTVAENPRSQQS